MKRKSKVSPLTPAWAGLQFATSVQHTESKNHFVPTTTTSPMSEPIVAPPPHVWANIVKKLDEQDRAKAAYSTQIVHLPMAGEGKKKLRRIYTILGGTLLFCCLIYLY